MKDPLKRRNRILEVCEEPGRVWDPVGGEIEVSSDLYLNDISDDEGVPQLAADGVLFGARMAVAMREVRESLISEGLSPGDNAVVAQRFLEEYPDYQDAFRQL